MLLFFHSFFLYKVNSLSILAEGAVAKATIAEEESSKIKGISQDLAAEKDLLLQRCSDLEAVCKGQSKQQTVASRLVSLSEDVRIHKLATMQQRREIQVLRQEKKHLQNVLATMEADVEDLEEGQVRAETKNLLLDIPSRSSFTSSSSALSDHKGKKNGIGNQNREYDYQVVKSENKGDSGGGGGILNDTIDDYKKLRGDLLSFSELEDEEGYDEKKDGSRTESGNHFRSRGGKSNMQSSMEFFFSNPENVKKIPPEDLIKKIEELNSNLSMSRKDAGELRLKGDRLQTALSECEGALQEMERHVTYYEGIMAQEGIPDIKGNQRVLSLNQGQGQGQGQGQNGRKGKQNFTIEDQENMQEAATATMTSMRQLLDEKNRMIEKYREKLEDSRSEKRPKSAADRKADDLLERLTQDTSKNLERRNGPTSSGDSGLGTKHPEDMYARNRLLEQIEQADQLLSDKDKTIQQLEQRLLSQENQRERAEIRCGTGIREMEAMKADMILLARQLQASESKYTAHTQKQLNDHLLSTPGPSAINPSTPTPGPVPLAPYSDVPNFDSRPKDVLDMKIIELQKNIKGKNEKIKGYRDIIIRLKEEFIKLEEDRAVSAAALKDKIAKTKIDDERDNNGPGQGSRRGRDGDVAEGGGGALGEQAMKELRGQIAALRDGLRLAKEDLEKARQTREKLNSARQAAQEESDRLESQVGRAEAQAAAAQEALIRTRKELEETRKREVRLREKLKDVVDNEGSMKVKNIKEAASRIEQLERESEVLRAQNLILRKAAAAEAVDSGEERVDQGTAMCLLPYDSSSDSHVQGFTFISTLYLLNHCHIGVD